MALPIAALITAFISNYRTPHEVVYQSVFDDPEPGADTDEVAADDGEGSSS
jgi:hypothetical protein